MPPRLVFYTGSPSADTLKWDGDNLLSTFIDPIARFAGITTTSSEPSTIPDSFDDRPVWRSLPLVRQQLPTGLTQNSDRYQIYEGGWEPDVRGASFFTTSQIESIVSQLSQEEIQNQESQSVQQVLSQFYEESYARHEDVLSSQIAPASSSEPGSTFTSDEFSYASISFDSLPCPRNNVPIAGHLSNLKDMPNAKYLDSIQPQTMTVNLIVGIISIPEPRTITTRRGSSVELIEVLVGDETKSGFGVNFWLPSSQAVDGDMRSMLQGLRPQDVVLMRNVALSSFKNRVYGQSLRKEMTKVHLLYRNRVDRDDAGGCYSASDLVSGEHVRPQVEKTRKVREWVVRFVGAGVGNKRGGRVAEVRKEVLPPDTQ